MIKRFYVSVLALIIMGSIVLINMRCSAFELEQEQPKKEDAATPNADNEDAELLKNFNLPKTCPKLTDDQKQYLEKKYDNIFEDYDELKDLLADRKELSNDEDADSRKIKNKIKRLNRKILRLKKSIVRDVQRKAAPYLKKIEKEKKLKEEYDEDIAQAEKNKNERLVEKIAQEYSRRGDRLGDAQKALDTFYYFLFWDNK
ncbi:MAG: hypothetical protein WCS73_06170 [Lentisphaeria bacterium]